MLFCITLFSQKIKGVITDSIGKPIAFANLIAKNSKNNIIDYCSSNQKGVYSLKIGKGTTTINITSLGFQEKNIQVNANTKIKNIKLKESTEELTPIFIETKKSKDTIRFLTKDILKGNEQVVEDLLKNIPDLDINRDGIIKYNNKEIEKIMIEGDDFFNKGYRLISKNMPSNPIKEIEVLENYSENKLLKNIEHSNNVALNLKLKEEAKSIWFGNITLGSGIANTKEQYKIKFNLMNFGKKTKVYTISTLNNIGENLLWDVKQITDPYNIFDPSALGDHIKNNNFLNAPSTNTYFHKTRVNFNNQKIISPNVIYNVNDKIKLKLLTFFNTDKKDYYGKQIMQYKIKDFDITNITKQINEQKLKNIFGKINGEYDLSKDKNLKSETKYNVSNTKDFFRENFNLKLRKENLNSKRYLFSQKLIFTKRFEDAEALVITGRYIKENKPQNRTLNNNPYIGLFNHPKNAKLKENTLHEMDFIGAEAHFFHKIKNTDQLVEMRVGNQLRKDKVISNFKIANEYPTKFQNNSNFFKNNLYIKSKFNIKKSNYTFNSKLDLHRLDLTINSQKTARYLINPSIYYKYKINYTNILDVSANYNSDTSEINNLTKNYIANQSRAFKKGLNHFPLIDYSNISFEYINGSYTYEDYEISAAIDYRIKHNFLAESIKLTQNYTLTENILMYNNDILNLDLKMKYYVDLINAKIELNNNFSTTKSLSILNNGKRILDFKSIHNNIVLRSGYTGIFNYHLNFNANTILFKETENTYKQTNFNSFLNLEFSFSKELLFETKVENYSFTDGNNYWFLDFNLEYKFLKNKIDVFLTGRNLFNIDKYSEYNLNNLGYFSNEYRILPRMVLLEIKYRF